MAEDKSKSECTCTWCSVGNEMSGAHSHRCVLRWIIKVIVLVFVFILGLTIGELRGLERSYMNGNGYGHGGMMQGRGYYNNYYQQPTGAYIPANAGTNVQQAIPQATTSVSPTNQ